MERVVIGPELSFSRIVYGMWRLGDDEDTSPSHVRNKISACLDQGITTIDHDFVIVSTHLGNEPLDCTTRSVPKEKRRILRIPSEKNQKTC